MFLILLFILFFHISWYITNSLLLYFSHFYDFNEHIFPLHINMYYNLNRLRDLFGLAFVQTNILVTIYYIEF